MSETTELPIVGKTIREIKNLGDELTFETECGERWRMWHQQDCCENVTLQDITGNLDDLIGTPLTMAEESTNNDDPDGEHESCTWTFYKFATVKGYVTLRWLGSSSGYYSERVDFEQMNAKAEGRPA